MRELKIIATIVLATVTAVSAQDDEKQLGWADEAELALVVTAGNSETTTFGFKNRLSHIWENAELHFDAGGLRTETSTITRTPVGTSIDDFTVEESRVSELTAENYFARAKYDRNIRPRVFLFGTGGWERNPFAGIQNRYMGAGGIGNIWYDRDAMRWRTDYGISITREEGTTGSSDTFAGLRLSSDFMRKLVSSTTLTNLTIANQNLEESGDFRLDSLTALAVSMTELLAIKLSLQFLFDNTPAFVDRPLEFPLGMPLNILVPVPADKLDTQFNVALVVTF